MWKNPWLMLVVGLLVGGLFGGVAGYVVNDLTSRENPEVMEQIQREREVQDDFERMLQELGSRPPSSATREAPAPAPGDAGEAADEAAGGAPGSPAVGDPPGNEEASE